METMNEVRAHAHIWNGYWGNELMQISRRCSMAWDFDKSDFMEMKDFAKLSWEKRCQHTVSAMCDVDDHQWIHMHKSSTVWFICTISWNGKVSSSHGCAHTITSRRFRRCATRKETIFNKMHTFTCGPLIHLLPLWVFTIEYIKSC